MKLFNTSTIYDESKAMLSELYEQRLLVNADRAILELKTYHLPGPDIRGSKLSLIPEIAFIREHDIHTASRGMCPSCLSTRNLYGQHTVLCLECWGIAISAMWKEFPIRIHNWTQIMNCQSYMPSHLSFIAKEPWASTIVATTVKDLLALTKFHLRNYPVMSRVEMKYWCSPKKTFLVLECGCNHCQYKPDFRDIGWFWSADFSDWSNGYCPNCLEHDISSQYVWGMDDAVYAKWQDNYTNTKQLQRTIARYGALSLLLVSPTAGWANYIGKVVPHISLRERKNIMASDLSLKPIGSLYRSSAKSLKDLGLNVEDMFSIKKNQYFTPEDIYA